MIVHAECGSVSLVAGASQDNLRNVMIRAYEQFPTYKKHFEECGVGRRDLDAPDISSVFSRLKPIDKSTYSLLQEDSLRGQRRDRFVVDPSSGTTGIPVLKFTSAADDEAEAAAVKFAFQTIRVGPGSRCACLDIGASQIYLFYMRVLQQFGVKDPLFVKVTSDHERAVRLLRAYDPDVILSIPSVLKRCLRALEAAYVDAPRTRKKVICIGEPMEDALRVKLQQILAADCFSFYGTTEVGSICADCASHAGMHLPLDLFVPTLFPLSSEWSCDLAPGRYRGIVAWTSLWIKEQPVIQYLVNDLVELDLSACACGSVAPRLVFQHRVDEAFFLYGITFKYDFFLETLEAIIEQPVLLEIKVIHHASAVRGPTDSIVLSMDEALAPFEDELMDGLSNVHPLSELIWCKFLAVKIEFVPLAALNRRKGRRVQCVDA